MKLIILKPKQSINKSYLKEKVHRADIENIKLQLKNLFDNIIESESEEYHKNLISDFLKDTFYKDLFFINTKDRKDLVIWNEKTPSSSAGVLIETKRPSNISQMISTTDINRTAFHELLLYYFNERIEKNNIDLKYLVATNIYEWFIFDAADFERLFYKNTEIVKHYKEWKSDQKVSSNTDFFYKEIAKRFLDNCEAEIKCTHFDLRDIKNNLNNSTNDYPFIPLYKIFSPVFLLKKPFANDSNSLDRKFYNELLHIIGLEEVKDKNKKLIKRKSSGKRDEGSIIENAITILKTRNKLSNIPDVQKYGADTEERAFNVALELSITWINRILFIKLLEAQLFNYHEKKKDFKFLNETIIKDLDELDKLFFEVLAVKPSERSQSVEGKYKNVPYLNSSLFEPTKLEHSALFIANLDDNKSIPYYSGTVLKDATGKKRKGNKPALHYLLEFLEAFDFASEGKEGIQEENKTLINASVLGLIFEKINGYKDGSYFTPGFITMYMSRETVRRAVVQKFNEKYGWKCDDFDDLKNHLADKRNKNEILEANEIVNSLTICDPAVGSGHFLVSVLNEIISVKSELGILADENGVRLSGYEVKVENDELIVTSVDGSEFYEYRPNQTGKKEANENHRVQKTLFHEKQRIIENSLFGVDINQNSVKIARLRLWIELLKNAYYTEESNFTELETLPNIDINIKQGNSLISRFSIDTDLKQVLKTIKWKIEDYKTLVTEYKNAPDKERKQAVQSLIDDIKETFRTQISARDPKRKKLNDLVYELHNKYETERLFDHELSAKEKDKFNKEKEKLINKIEKQKEEIKEIEEGEIYRDAFEWRFEFPEVLADNGDFIGFDIVIGNPPYIYRNIDIKPFINYYKSNYKTTEGNFELYKYFIENSVNLVTNKGYVCLITSASFIIQDSFEKTRNLLLSKGRLNILVPLGPNVFDEATVDTALFIFSNSNEYFHDVKVIVPKEPKFLTNTQPYEINQQRFIKNDKFVMDYLINNLEFTIIQKLFLDRKNLLDYYDISVGINTGYIRNEMISENKINNKFHPLVLGSGIERYGPVKQSGWIMYDPEYVKSKGRLGRSLPPEFYFRSNKILVVRTRNLSLKRRLIATIDLEKCYNLNRLTNIISKNDSDLFSLLGILNSNLFNWLFSKRFYDYEIKPNYLKQCPIADNKNSKISDLVKAIYIQKREPKSDTTALENEIDILVYKLYGLTYDEVRIIDPEIEEIISEEDYNKRQ